MECTLFGSAFTIPESCIRTFLMNKRCLEFCEDAKIEFDLHK